jgi:hypothetical protein
MLELTLGAIAAALIAKALDRAEGEALDQGEGALRRLVAAVRKRFSGEDDAGSVALARVEDAPDSKSRIEALAGLLDAEAQRDPEFGRDLSGLVEEAKGAGVDFKSVVQTAYGDQDPIFNDVRDSDVQVNYYGSPPPGRPRRIAE